MDESKRKHDFVKDLNENSRKNINSYWEDKLTNF